MPKLEVSCIPAHFSLEHKWNGISFRVSSEKCTFLILFNQDGLHLPRNRNAAFIFELSKVALFNIYFSCILLRWLCDGGSWGGHSCLPGNGCGRHCGLGRGGRQVRKTEKPEEKKDEGTTERISKQLPGPRGTRSRRRGSRAGRGVGRKCWNWRRGTRRTEQQWKQSRRWTKSLRWAGTWESIVRSARRTFISAWTRLFANSIEGSLDLTFVMAIVLANRSLSSRACAWFLEF